MKRINFNDFELITFADLNGVGIQGGKEQLKELLKDFIVGQYDLILSGLNVLPTGTPDASVHVQAGFAVSRYGYPIIAPSIMSVSLTGITAGRYCNVEVQLLEVDVDPEDRYFIDANGNTSVENVNKGVELRAQARVVEGTAGAAPSVGAGWTKVAEVYWDGTSVETADIANVSQWYVDADNTGWTTDKRITIKSRKAHDHRTAAVIDHPDASIPITKLDPELTAIVLGGSPSDGTHSDGVIRGYLNELALTFKDAEPLLNANDIKVNSGALLRGGEFLRVFSDGLIKQTGFNPTDPVRFASLDTRIRVGKTKGIPNPSGGDYETVNFTSGNTQPLACKWDTTSRLTGVANGQSAPTSLAPQKVYRNAESGEVLQVWDFTGTVQYTVSYDGADTGDFDIDTATGEITRISLVTSVQVQVTYTYALVRHVLLEATTLDVFVKEGDYSITGIPLYPTYTGGRTQLAMLAVAAKMAELDIGALSVDLRMYSHKIETVAMPEIGRQVIIDGGVQIIQKQRYTRVFENIPWERVSSTFTVTIPANSRYAAALDDLSAGYDNAGSRYCTLLELSDRSMFTVVNASYINIGQIVLTKTGHRTLVCSCDDAGATSGTISFAFGIFRTGAEYGGGGAVGWSKTSGVVTLSMSVRAASLLVDNDYITIKNTTDAVNLPNGIYKLTNLTDATAEFICAVGGDATGTCTVHCGRMSVLSPICSVWRWDSKIDADERVVPDDLHIPNVRGCRRSMRFAWFNGGWDTAMGVHANALADASIYQFIEPTVMQELRGRKVSISFYAKADVVSGINPNSLRVDFVGAGNKLIGTKLTGNSYITYRNVHHNSGSPSGVIVTASDNVVEQPLGHALATSVDNNTFTVETGVVAASDETIEATIVFLDDGNAENYVQDMTAYMSVADEPDYSITLKHDAVGTSWVRCTVEGVTIPSNIESFRYGANIRFTIPKNTATATKFVWLAAFQMNIGETVMEFAGYSKSVEAARVQRFAWTFYAMGYAFIGIGFVNSAGVFGCLIHHPQPMWRIPWYTIYYGYAVLHNYTGNIVVTIAAGANSRYASWLTTSPIAPVGAAISMRTAQEGEAGSVEEGAMFEAQAIPIVM